MLTPKQKAEKAAAEARLKALVDAGGVTVAGLQNKGDDAPKRVNYGSKKKAQPKKGPAADTKSSQAVESTPEPAAEAPIKVEEPAKPVVEDKAESEEDVKDDWDASSDEEKAESVKDDWDASSDEEEKKEEPKKAAPVPSKGKRLERAYNL